MNAFRRNDTGKRSFLFGIKSPDILNRIEALRNSPNYSPEVEQGTVPRSTSQLFSREPQVR